MIIFPFPFQNFFFFFSGFQTNNYQKQNKKNDKIAFKKMKNNDIWGKKQRQ